MTRAQRIIRFTFWMNNLFLGIIGMLFWSAIANHSKWLVGSLVLLVVGAFVFQYWYLTHYLGVKQFSGLYFVDDEHEKMVALRVHNACMNTFINSTYVLMVVVFLLMQWQLTIRIFGNVILGLLIALILGVNYQYYYLWRKYDPA